MSHLDSVLPLATRFAWSRSIAGRLILWFLLISLVPCGILTLISARDMIKALENATRYKLEQIAATKANELESYAVERLADATTLAHTAVVIGAVAHLGSSDQAIVAAAASNLNSVAASFGYQQLLLINTSGTILYCADPTFVVGSSILAGDLATTEIAASYQRSRTLLQTEMTAFQIYKGQTTPTAFVMSPILNRGGRVIGVLAGGLSPDRVWRALRDMTGLGQTGEIVTSERVGDSLLITAPLRHQADAAFRLQLPIGSGRGSAIQRAASGERGYGAATDYRGQEVVGAWCYLPSFRWGMFVKQDADEAFALLNAQRKSLIALLIAIVIGVTLTALLVARSISKPIRTAAAVAKAVAGGNLRSKVGETANDETGALLIAIQMMTNDLRGLIGRIQQSSLTLTSTATVIQTTSNDQSQVVSDFAAATNDAVAAVKEITSTSQELARTMTEVNQLAASTGKKAAEGREDLEGMDATMRRLEQSTTSIGAKLATIDERASNINMVIVTMVKVADQTNLLSINAAIEAEKAGDYGLGFLVVAREISRLADQTAIASLDIERMVKEMQGAVTAGVKEMNVFAEQVRGGVREIEDISGKLGEIITAVQGISGRFGQVTEGVRAQSQGAEQIGGVMARLADGAARTTASIHDSNKATIELRAAVSELEKEVLRFEL